MPFMTCRDGTTVLNTDHIVSVELGDNSDRKSLAHTVLGKVFEVWHDEFLSATVSTGTIPAEPGTLVAIAEAVRVGADMIDDLITGMETWQVQMHDERVLAFDMFGDIPVPITPSGRLTERVSPEDYVLQFPRDTFVTYPRYNQIFESREAWLADNIDRILSQKVGEDGGRVSEK